MTDTLLFTKQEWDAALPDVVHGMTTYLRQYRVGIFKHNATPDDEHGEGWGSGSFIVIDGRTFILTNDHVAQARTSGIDLTYQLQGDDRIHLVVGDHLTQPFPLDLALLPVNQDIWLNDHGSKGISFNQIAIAHTPVKGELLTFSGFSGDSVSFHFGILFSEATCSTAREVRLPADERFDERFHFGVDYRPDLAANVIGSSGLQRPPGLSGSAVWNTRFVEAKMRGETWTPDMAQLTGIVWGWPSSTALLVATRAEYVRSFLLGAVQPR